MVIIYIEFFYLIVSSAIAVPINNENAEDFCHQIIDDVIIEAFKVYQEPEAAVPDDAAHGIIHSGM